MLIKEIFLSAKKYYDVEMTRIGMFKENDHIHLLIALYDVCHYVLSIDNKTIKVENVLLFSNQKEKEVILSKDLDELTNESLFCFLKNHSHSILPNKYLDAFKRAYRL